MSVSQETQNADIYIKATNLQKHYQLGETTVKALDGVDISIKRGEMIVIVGPSGSGKSTLVNMLGGVDRPDSGEVFVGDQKINEFKSKQLTRFRRENVGFVFQFYSLIPTLTAEENVALAAELIKINGKKLKQRTLSVLEDVGLKGRERSYPSQLSGGERQRVALARALAKRPAIVIVDEPTGQLDSQSGENMVKLIRDTSKKYQSTVIMVTHDSSFLKYADRIIKMDSGKIIGD